MKNLCLLRLSDSDFENKLDSDLQILPFTNGYFDLMDKTFKAYTEYQIISMTFPFEYRHYDSCEEIERIFMSIFPDDIEFEYVYKVLATFLDSSFPNDKLIIFRGSGSNGKSLLIRLLSLVFGKFSTSLSSNFFTYDETNVGGANPVLRDFKHQ